MNREECLENLKQIIDVMEQYASVVFPSREVIDTLRYAYRRIQHTHGEILTIDDWVSYWEVYLSLTDTQGIKLNYRSRLGDYEGVFRQVLYDIAQNPKLRSATVSRIVRAKTPLPECRICRDVSYLSGGVVSE